MKIRTRLVSGFEPALFGMRNPKNSWRLIDSKNVDGEFIIGEKDLELAQRLIKAGNEHMKFMRQIQVWADMDMTRFFWSEMDTYKYNTKNSCSTMHKLLTPKNEITLDMFDVYEEDWQDTFCKWVTTLPYAKELIFCGLENEFERLK